jgi:Glycosyl-transferase for dystroglycan
MFKRRSTAISAATLSTAGDISDPEGSPTNTTALSARTSMATNGAGPVDGTLPPLSGSFHSSCHDPNGSFSNDITGNATQDKSSSPLDKKLHGKRRRRQLRSLLLLRLRHQSTTERMLLLLSAGLFLILLSWMRASSFTFPIPAAPAESELQHPPFQLESANAPVCNVLSSPDDVSFTLVTQLSDDRLWMMEHHCRRYPHPMAIAVYTNTTLEQVLDRLRGMGCSVAEESQEPRRLQQHDQQQQRSQTKGEEKSQNAAAVERDDDENLEVDDDKAQVLLHNFPKGPALQVAVLDSSTHGKLDDYPVNDLRNLALSMVKSSHIIYIDVDFWASDYLYEMLSKKEVKERLIRDPQHAVVIPAFQLFRQCRKYEDCRGNNIPRMPQSLSDLALMMKKRRGHIFDPTNTGGHGSTDYNAWFRQSPGELLDIKCLQSNRYEPYVAIRYCNDMPPFQEAFSGYGKNKVTWMMQVIASGYTLSQLGGVYLVHYPHLESASRTRWNESPEQLQVAASDSEDDQNPIFIRRPTPEDGNLDFHKYKRGQVDKIFLEFKDWLAQTIPSSRARLRLCESAQDDDSKLWVGPDLKEGPKKKDSRESASNQG